MPRFALISLLSVALIAGCSREDSDGGSGAGGGGKPTIAVTIIPLASLTQQLVGDAAEVVTLIPAGISPHGYEPTAQQMEALQRASIVVLNGAGYDNWAKDVAARRRNKPAIFVFAEMVGAETAEHGEHEDHKGHAKHEPHQEQATGTRDVHDHDHGGVNPHLWVDPVLARKFVHVLAHELAEHIPAAAAAIEANEARLLDDLKQLDADYAALLAPHKGRPIVTFHNAFDPLAERYGLKVGLTLMPNDAIGATLTPGRLEEAIQTIRDADLKAIYSEPQFPADIASPIVQTTGVKVLVLDPLGDPDQPDRDTYQKMMRFNLERLVQGFQ